MKKAISILLAMTLVLSTVGCSKQAAPAATTDTPAVAAELTNKGDKLVVWTFSDELKGMIEKHYLVDNPNLGYEVEVVVVPNENYQTKLDPVLASGKNAPDVFAMEAAYLKKYVDSDYTMDLSKLGFMSEGTPVLDYVMDLSKDKNGQLKGLSWQGTPGAFFYRKSLAKQYLGVSEPEEVQPLLADFDKFYSTSKTVYDKSGGKVKGISSLGDIAQVFFAARTDGWVVDNKFVVDPKIDELFEFAKEMQQGKLTSQAEQWTESWFAGMSDDSVFGYFLPTWGLHYVLKANAENATTGKSTSGDWAMVQGPASYFWGGSFLGVRQGTEMEKASKDLVNYLTMDEAFLEKWAKETGDFVANKNVVTKIKDTYTEPFLAGQNHYAAFAEMAGGIDASILTGYDQEIQRLMNEQLTAYANGEKDKATAMNDFKSAVKNAYPDLEVK